MMHRLILLSIFILYLAMAGIAKEYKGAEYRTIEGFKYGRFEVCYIPAAAEGMLASYFTYHDFTTGTIDWNEIDIEILGRYEDDAQFTVIGPKQFIYNSHCVLDFNPHLDYHVYAFEWTPDYVAWFVDGQEMYRQTGDHIGQLIHHQQLMMNTWAPDGNGIWTGVWNPDLLPVFSYYDWVSYASYAPDSGDTGTNNNFKLEWRDDFDEWDQNRWTKATHTWGGNRVDFVTENVVFHDGKMILCLTDENNLGYVDKKPPKILWVRARRDKLTVRFTERVDPGTANDPTKYTITGATLSDASLLEDGMTVECTISALDTSKSYTLVVFGMKDTPPGANTQLFDSESIIQAKPLKFPLKINVGGGSLYDGEYLPDQMWGPTVEYGRMDGYADKWPAVDIQGTEEDSLYLVSVHEAVKYKVRVPNGRYDVTLYMSENQFTEQGKRIFSIAVEGQEIIKDLDIFKEVGPYHAFEVKAENVEINDSVIDLHFYNWTEKPTLSGIYINQISTALESDPEKKVLDFKLNQNYPNPFNSSTAINYSLPKSAQVLIRIYDLLGREVATPFKGLVAAGHHTMNYEADGLAGGVYFYKLTASFDNGTYEAVGKMLLIK